MIAYLNLIWEEQFLAKERTIPRRLWRLWEPEIRKVLCSDFAMAVMQEYDFHFPDSITCDRKRMVSQFSEESTEAED